MSSPVRRIIRQQHPSDKVHRNKAYGTIYANPPRQKFYMGRGKMLGVKNLKDKSLLARIRREKRNLARKEAR